MAKEIGISVPDYIRRDRDIEAMLGGLREPLRASIGRWWKEVPTNIQDGAFIAAGGLAGAIISTPGCMIVRWSGTYSGFSNPEIVAALGTTAFTLMGIWVSLELINAKRQENSRNTH